MAKLDHSKLDTYFGIRKPIEMVNVSLNMYAFIKHLNLIHFSQMRQIPELYVKALFLYIIQVSKALGHAHKHGLVHGKFDLSKVIIQRMKFSSLNPDYDHTFNEFNYYVTSFEPFTVFRMMKEYS